MNKWHKNKLIFFYLLVICLLSTGCNPSKNQLNCKKLIKVEITDSCLNNILAEYIRAFPFKGKGIYLTTVKRSSDTIKYYVSVVFTEEELNTTLKDPPYYFYNSISQRIVIVDTKFENHIKLSFVKSNCDTILTKYYDSERIGGWRDVYCVEFKSFSDTITRKAVQFDPF